MKYWALDYVDDSECELVVNDQLYLTEESALYAATATRRPDLYEVTWYTIPDLKEIYDGDIYIDSHLKIHKADQL